MSFHFLPKKPGAWILAAEHLGKQGELGPFPGDYRMEMDLEEIPVVAEVCVINIISTSRVHDLGRCAL